MGRAEARLLPGHDSFGPRDGQKSDLSALRQKVRLFDHLVGGGDECLRDGEAERLGGVAINHQRNFGGLLYGEVCRLFAFEDSIDVAGCTSVLVDQIRPVGDQAAAADEQAERVDCGQIEVWPPARQ